MAEALKILGQAAPAAVTLSPLYTVPAATQTAVSTLQVCNRENVSATFRIAVAVAGAADAIAQYLYYDALVPANTSVSITIGITLASTDVVRVQASSSNLSFNLFGVEVS